jgi:hypothetical protein
MKNSRHARSGKRRWWIGPVVALAMIGAALPAQAQGRDRCVNVVSPRPIILPDGSRHEPGLLQLCLNHVSDPVTAHLKIRVNGQTVGIAYPCRVGVSEARTEDPIVVFKRASSGEFYLVGYAWPDGETMRTYRLHESRFGRKVAALMAKAPLLEETEGIALMAAVRNGD